MGLGRYNDINNIEIEIDNIKFQINIKIMSGQFYEIADDNQKSAQKNGFMKITSLIGEPVSEVKTSLIDVNKNLPEKPSNDVPSAEKAKLRSSPLVLKSKPKINYQWSSEQLEVLKSAIDSFKIRPQTVSKKVFMELKTREYSDTRPHLSLEDVWQWFSTQSLGVIERRKRDLKRRRDVVLNYKSRRSHLKVQRKVKFFPSVRVRVLKEGDDEIYSSEVNRVNSNIFVKLKY